MTIPTEANKTGGEPILSDAYTINGQPGYLYPCSREGALPRVLLLLHIKICYVTHFSFARKSLC